MVFLCTPAQTHIAPKSAFLLAWKGKRGLSLSLSFSLLFVSSLLLFERIARGAFWKRRRGRKKKRFGKIFFARARKGTNILHTVFDFFSLSLVLVLSGRRRRRRVPPPRERERERERERCVSLQKRSSSLVLLNIRVLSLCSFAALNIFYSFSSEKVDKKKRSVVSDFSTGFFDSKSASCLPHLT